MIMRLAAVFFTVSLAGCSVLPTSEPKELYTLPSGSISLADALSDQAETARMSRLSDRILRVRTPHADRLTASQRILVHPGAGHVQAYKDVRWADTPPRMVRNYLIHALRSHSEVGRVVSDETGTGVDIELEMDLARFQVDYVDERPVVRIQLDAILMDPDSRRIMTGTRLSASREVQGKEVPEVVTAFGQAMAGLTADLIRWLDQPRSD